jgi:hypothetical protein
VSPDDERRRAKNTGKWAIIAAAVIEAIVIAVFIWRYRG